MLAQPLVQSESIVYNIFSVVCVCRWCLGATYWRYRPVAIETADTGTALDFVANAISSTTVIRGGAFIVNVIINSYSVFAIPGAVWMVTVATAPSVATSQGKREMIASHLVPLFREIGAILETP